MKNSPNLQKILTRIRTEGVSSYERYLNVGAFAQFLSFFDSQITALTYDHMENAQETSLATFYHTEKSLNKGVPKKTLIWP